MKNPEVPFKDQLNPSEFGSDTTLIMNLENHPDKVVRVDPVHESTEKFIEKSNKVKVLLEELKNRYSISIPEFEYVLGKDKHGEQVR
jgi:hypothetical protein